MFPNVPQNVSFPQLEEEILAFWKEQNVYEQSLDQRAGNPSFVFYEGPPTANGKPHPGHCLTRAIKDLFPRYKTMRGYRCERKAGWDTHGLPVEVEVCKELGIHSKEEIEEYGVEPFIQKCQASVWRYMQEWERLTERLGFWVNLEDAYVTYHQSYVESVWYILKNLFDRGLLYEGHKIVWWWAQGGTALSSGEVGQGYREVADPSVYVLFPLVDDPNTNLVAWTTTPWTLPSNQFAAVHPDLNYVKVRDPETDKCLIVAEALAEKLGEKLKRELAVEGTLGGKELIGKRYVPPFDYYYKNQADQQGKTKAGEKEHTAWTVRSADFVTTDSGTGIVHIAPAFGEVDYELLVAEQDRFEAGEGPELICAVGPDGKFTDDAAPYKGRWVKEADKDLARDVKERGLLLHLEQYLHDYPFCWRAEQDPLIQYPRRSWFVKTTQFKDEMLANNQQINWLPDHIKGGRFGNFLESNVDWALSRERYWGTPLPVWVCEETGRMEAVGGYDELLTKDGLQGTEVWEQAKKANPDLPEDLKVHKPYIDAITYDSPFSSGSRMRRVSEVIDCWFDSGAMPFAQWGFPKGDPEKFNTQYPADFISEAIDQTRGWFYSLLAISTLMLADEENNPEGLAFPYPFKNCIVLGLMLSEWYEDKDGGVHLNEEEARKSGKKYKSLVGKMSKSKRNYREPGGIFDSYGADALRWYFFANQAPWTSIRYSERSIKESIPEFLLRLWNVFSFFTIYANIDGFDPAANAPSQDGQFRHADFVGARGFRPVSERSELDRWVLSELNQTIESVTKLMDEYSNYEACQQINEFVDGLSNWFVRRSRDRYWSSDKENPDKLDAYWTLYECLLTTSKLIAPFTPFLSDYLWRNLTGIFGNNAAVSVHLCDYPVSNGDHTDAILSEQMNLVRDIASLGRSARMNNKLKVRQPLSKVEVILADDTHRAFLDSHSSLIATELNVKEVEFTTESEQYISYEIQPNFRLLGPMLGKDLPAVKKLLGVADGNELSEKLAAEGKIELTLDDGRTVELNDEQVQRRLVAKEGWAAAEGKKCVVVLSTELTPSLIREGYARDLVRYIQDQRKAIGCEFTDRIVVGIVSESDELQEAITEFGEYIQNETLADSVSPSAASGAKSVDQKIGDIQLDLYVTRA